MTLVIEGPLAVPVVDTNGAALRLVLADTGQAAVASACVVLDASWTLRLDVLAASHRVAAHHRGEPRAVETVACDVGAADPVAPDHLPASHRWSLPGGGVGTFASRSVAGPDALHAARAVWASQPVDRSLVVAFPGHPDAITAVVVDPVDGDAVGWRTWHCYPGRRAHVVETTTRLEVR